MINRTILNTIVFLFVLSHLGIGSAEDVKPVAPNSPAVNSKTDIPPTTPASTNQAIAVIPQPSYEFGSVMEGKEVIHDFIVQNKGNVNLDIINVRPG
ncbi:MAG: hypothetical protein HQK77_06545 [Desulfobacterales bacterium]|nr:hypothetical protein [Desulfobacterales bacterium]